jgi:hypothetical protein
MTKQQKEKTKEKNSGAKSQTNDQPSFCNEPAAFSWSAHEFY